MRNILFIHPDPKLVKLYEPLLSEHFQFDSAHDGLTGLRKIRINRPKLVISEYKLPHLSGLGLLKYIRNEPDLAATPFIFFSEHDNLEQALSLAANEWVYPRHSSPELLLNKIYQHIKYGLHIN